MWLVAAGVSVLAAILTASATAAPAGALTEPKPRIVGGEPATITTHPWHVAVAERQSLREGDQSAFERQFCAGALLAPTVVVTAAHCVYEDGQLLPVRLPIDDCAEGGGFVFPATEFSIIAGRTTLSEPAGQEIDVAEVWFFAGGVDGRPTLHAQSDPAPADPLYRCESNEWDVAVLELSEAASPRPIRIAGPGERSAWEAGRLAEVSGWGTTSETGPKSDTLRSVRIPVVADGTCGSPSSYGPAFSAATMVCAGDLEGGRDACSSDSGGGLVVPLEGGRMRLIGGVSFGDGCGRANKPGVYSRLADNPIRPALGRAVRQLADRDVVGKARKKPGKRRPAGIDPSGRPAKR